MIIYTYMYITMILCSFIVVVDKMAEGPDPANQCSQDMSSPQEEQEPVVVEPDVTCGHCKEN